MSDNYNSDLTKEIMYAAYLKAGVDNIPSKIGDTIIPVIDVNPKHCRILNQFNTASGSNSNITIFTAPSDRDYFLTNLSCGVNKTSTSDNGVSTVDCTINGALRRLMIFAGMTLTAENVYQTINYQFPIKIDRGTTITMSRTATTVGTCIFSGSVAGYTVENTANN